MKPQIRLQSLIAVAAKRKAITADLTLSDGETAAEILLLECELVDRVGWLLGETETVRPQAAKRKSNEQGKGEEL